jgi:prepilin-type N-terminal cleavage/methylation domain-containing protein
MPLHLPDKKLKAFTLAEMLVTLALTSLLLSFCYLSFNYVQHLLSQFSRQSFFITQLNELNKRSNLLMAAPGIVIKENEGLIFRSDSMDQSIKFTETSILLTRFGKTDTFFMAADRPRCSFETLGNPAWQNRLVNGLEFDVQFQDQKFHLAFHKTYDAGTKLNLEKEP